MSTTQVVPTVRNAGTTAQKPRKLFVNIPVRDLQRSIDFFETLGFTFNTQFTDAKPPACWSARTPASC
jgi:predicted enzyme related to lactoylglutathione lyase